MAGERANAQPAYTAMTLEMIAMPRKRTPEESKAQRAAYMAAYNRAYYARNREKLKADCRNYYEANKARDHAKKSARSERDKNRHKARMKDDPEYRITYNKYNRDKLRNMRKVPALRAKFNEQSRMWRKANPEHARENTNIQKHRRRARIAKCQENHTRAEWRAVLSAHGNRCAWCGAKGTEEAPLTRDHYVAIANGGTNAARNLVPACKPCNWRKNRKDPIDFAQSLGRLL